MGKKIDLLGQKFGYLTVIEEDGSNSSGNAMWKCECDCGNKVSVRGIDLRRGHTKSCGCYRPKSKVIDMTGQKFGQWTVLKFARIGKDRKAIWECRCSCGNIKEVVGTSLRNGESTSCGCIRSKTEVLIATILDEHKISYKPQYIFDDLRGKRNSYLRFDFGILNNENELLGLIEFQGELHEKPYNMRNNSSFERQLECDQMKRDYCL